MPAPGLEAISKALARNTSLTSFTLSRLYLPGDAWNPFFDALKVNSTLTSFDLNNSLDTDILRSRLLSVLEGNTSITSFEDDPEEL